MSAGDGPRVRTADDVASLSAVAQSPSVETALDAVRELLGVEVAYTTEMDEVEQRFIVLLGDGASFGVGEGTVLPIGATYCHHILAGRLPHLISDVRSDPIAGPMAVTESADVGAFASVPLLLSDGRLLGTLCAASHTPRPGFRERDLQFLRVFARIVADQLEREESDERERTLQLQAAAARTLVAAVGARDSYTEEHSRRVVERAGSVARHLGLAEDEVLEVELVALLHDIGKIAVADSVLRKPAALADDEWRAMREHPIVAERLIGRTPGLERLAPMIRAEHEHWDGTGYPDGLAGEEIPLASRITLVCDAHHAMTSDRPYRGAVAAEEARAEMLANAGTQFDPAVVEALLAVLDSDGAAP